MTTASSRACPDWWIRTETGVVLAEIASRSCGNRTKSCGNRTKSCGNRTKSCGNRTKSCGNHTKSSGNHTKSSGNHSKSSGNHTKSSGNHSKSSGNHTKSSGNHTKSSGNHTKSSGNRSKSSGDAQLTRSSRSGPRPAARRRRQRRQCAGTSAAVGRHVAPFERTGTRLTNDAFLLDPGDFETSEAPATETLANRSARASRRRRPRLRAAGVAARASRRRCAG